MKTNTDLSIEIMYRMKEFLNNEIRQTGEIKINNKKIWDGWLHKMDNTVWRGILSTLAELEQQHPHLFTLHQSRGIEQGLALLDKYDAYYDNVLDMKNKHVRKLVHRCWDLPSRSAYHTWRRFGHKAI